MKWKLELQAAHDHYFFSNDYGQVAIADQSLRIKSDPSSTDDGLLLVDETSPFTFGFDGGRTLRLRVPVVAAAQVSEEVRPALFPDQRKSWVSTTLSASKILLLRRFGFDVQVTEEFAELVEAMRAAIVQSKHRMISKEVA